MEEYEAVAVEARGTGLGRSWTLSHGEQAVELASRGTYFSLQLQRCECPSGEKIIKDQDYFLYCDACHRPHRGSIRLPTGQVDEAELRCLFEEAFNVARVDPLTTVLVAHELATLVNKLVSPDAAWRLP